MSSNANTFGYIRKSTQSKIAIKFKENGSKFIAKLSALGKALMFPIAVLPIAGILNRIGAQIPATDVSNFTLFVGGLFRSVGNVVFNNLHILFGIGVAFGFTKDNRGEAALVGFIGILLLSYLMGNGYSSFPGVDLPKQIYGGIDFPKPSAEQIASGEYSDNSIGFERIFGIKKYNSILANNVLNGIISGCLIAFIYNKFNSIELPKILGFFSGRRLIPVLGILSIVFFGIVYAIIFPWIGYLLYLISNGLISATGNTYANAGISGVYSFLNRLLIPFGLHHVPNTLFWFTFGQFKSGDGFVYGDINGFLNGDVIQANNQVLTAGTFQTGFFPMMMFGLPMLCYALYKNADNKEQKQKVLSLFGPAAVVSFLTGITEPIEFAFMFVSPLLYFVHAILSGLFAFLTNLFGIQLGFSFSAGFVDYLLSIPKSVQIADAKATHISSIVGVFANPGWIFVIGPVCGLSYFFISNLIIKKLNLQTPGRGQNIIRQEDKKEDNINSTNTLSNKAKKIILGLGGWDNITNYQSCTTRLRYEIKDYSKVDEKLIHESGAMGFKKISDKSVQIIIGQEAELLNDQIIKNKNQDLTLQTNNNVKENVKTNRTKQLSLIFNSPVDGKTIKLENMSDTTFALMGKGLAIEPKTNKIIINNDCKLLSAFKTGHAYIVEANGYSVLIHIGVNTVELGEDNKIFKSKYIGKENVNLKKGDVLAEVDFEKLKELGYDTTIVVIVLEETLSKDDKFKLLVKENKNIKNSNQLFSIN